MKSSTARKEESVRDLIIPIHNPKIYPVIWRKDDLRRVKTASVVVSKEQRQQQIEKFEADRKRLELESEKRKQFLKDIDKIREEKRVKRVKEINDSGEDPKQILEKAFLARQEENEEVKRANRIILATKCHIVRDAQVNEKQGILRSLRDHELQLEKKILEECEKALIEEKKRRDQLKVEKEKHANDLRKQLEFRELNKLLEAQRVEEEAKVASKAKIAIENDLKQKRKSEQEKIARIRNDLMQTTEMSNHFKNRAFEEQRIAEMKAQEYMRMRQERDIQLAKERRHALELKQRQSDRLLVLQKKFLDTKHEQERQKLRKLQEEKEREFREKEKQSAIKRNQLEKQVIEARQAQIDEMKRQRAMQLSRDETEHKQITEKLRQAEEKELQERAKLYRLRENYKQEILNQIEQKEKRKKEWRIRSKSEYDALQREEEAKIQKIKDVVVAKVNALRQANIPENFIKKIECQLNLTEK